MQAGMLFHWMLDRSSDVYCEQYIFTITGVLDKNLVEKSFQKLVQRYDIFRTIFHYQNTKEPLQIVLKQRSFNLHFEDILHINPEEQKKFLEEKKKKNKEIGFDLTKDLLIRTQLFKTNDNSYVLVWIFHHILMDGWCMGILFEELITTYRALKNGVPAKLEPPVPFCNYLRWLEQQDKEEGLKFWREYLDNYTIQATLPKLNVLPENYVYDHEEYNFEIDRLLSRRLEEIAKEKHVSLNMLCQAIWGILLHKYNNTNDVVFGSVVSGRPPGIKNIENMVGLFINTIPVRIKTGDLTNFSLLIMQLQQNTVLAKRYEYLPLAEVQATSQLKRDLIDHIMVFENFPIQEKLQELNRETDFGYGIDDMSHTGRTNHDFHVRIIPGEQLLIRFIFNSSVYMNDLVKKIALHFMEIVKQVVVDTDIKLNRVSVLCEEEKKQVLYDFNDTTAEYPKDKLIHQLFAEQAARTPDNIALVGPVQVEYRTYMTYITYKELNEKSNRLAFLFHQKGVKTDIIVGIMAEPAVEMIIAVLGILKAGAAYLPIHPDYPRERINYMLKDSEVKVLVNKDKNFNEIRNGPKLFVLDFEHLNFEFVSNFDIRISDLNASNLAYVIYTSGTTGKPKGTLLKHQNLVNYVNWFSNHARLTNQDKSLLTSSFAFDLGYTTIYPSLLNGGQLHILPKETYMLPESLLDYIRLQGITYLKMTPSLFSPLVSHWLFSQNTCHSLRLVVLGGEAIQVTDVEKAYGICRHLDIMNHYGPTEVTIGCIAQLIAHRMHRPIDRQGKPGNL
jgi:non-ribosomal peptide synthetase component F